MTRSATIAFRMDQCLPAHHRTFLRRYLYLLLFDLSIRTLILFVNTFFLIIFMKISYWPILSRNILKKDFESGLLQLSYLLLRDVLVSFDFSDFTQSSVCSSFASIVMKLSWAVG